jgi:hypothetical protein
MKTKAFKLLATSLLALVLVCVFFVSASPQAHAAQLKPAVAKSNLLPMGEKRVNNSDNENACTGITSHWYVWGEEWYLPKCAAQQLANGVNIIPGGGNIASTLINNSIEASCNGSVYVDQIGPINLAVFTVRSAC